MTTWIPTDRTRGGYEPADSQQSKEYSDLSVYSATVITPGSYANPIGAVTPPTTSIRPAPPQLDPVQLVPSPPPDIPTSGSWSSKSSTQTSTMNDGTAQIKTTTTTTQSSLKFNNGLVDASIIPYMRRLDIDFIAVGMRPNRRVYFFFDDKDVTDYISLTNSITLNLPHTGGEDPIYEDIGDDSGTIGSQIISNTSPNWTVTGNPTQGHTKRDFRGRRKMHIRRRKRFFDENRTVGNPILEISGAMDSIPANSSIRTLDGSATYSVKWNEVRTGKLQPQKWFLTTANTSNAALMASTIVLSEQFAHLPNNWWGTDGSNSVFMLTHNFHPKRGRTKMRIRGWNNATRRLTVDPSAAEDVPGFKSNPFIADDDAKILTNDGGESIGDAMIHITPTDTTLGLQDSDELPTDAAGVFKTDETGSISGCFHLPGGIFFTGQKIFRIIDSKLNDTDDDATTTYAEYKFVAQGLHTVVQDVVINSTMTNTTVIRTPNPPPPGNPPPPKKPFTSPPKSPPPRAPNCCFIPSAMVTMADGSKKPICEIVSGDEVLSKVGSSRVTDIIVTHLGERELYGFAGVQPFATEDHPFLTNKGWSSYKIGEYHDHLVRDNVENINWDPMTNEEEVLHVSGFVAVDQIVTKSATVNQLVYALTLDDSADHTYWVEDFLTHNKASDPLAQSFFVEIGNYPQGMFVSSVDLFFANKDPALPVHIEIRPTVNGYPDSNFVVPGSKVSKQSAEVKLSEAPSVTNSATATKFKFADPVYLPAGEYALVVHSLSVDYEVFVSELGEKIIGTSNIVSEQPYIGSIFKSQNASTWDASQLEDLMFQINKCKFEPEGRAYLYSSSAIQPEEPYGLFPIPVDEIMLHTEQSILAGTDLSYELASDSSNVYSSIQAGVVLIPDTGRVYYPATSDDPAVQEGFFKLLVNMSTENPDISPVIWSERFGAGMFENQIDNAELGPLDFKIVSTGSGYDANSELALTFSGSGNGDAEVYAVSNSTGHIVDIVFDTYGSGFLEDTTVTVNSANGSGALIEVSSETHPSGGPAWCKYISRIVTLNEGFESADLKTFVTAYKPIGTGVHVYYKVRNHNDPEAFSAKPWNKMIQKQYLVEYSRNTKDYLEYEFSPFGEAEPFESISYQSGGATYTTFDQYAIKIVLTTDDTTKFPVLKDMRAIAMPAAEQL